MSPDEAHENHTSANSSSTEEGKERAQLEVLADQFNARIEGFRELLEVTSPQVAALDKPEGIEHAIRKSGLSSRGKNIVKSMFIVSEDEDQTESTGPDPATAKQVDVGTTGEFTDLVQNEPSGLLRVLRRFTQGVLVPRSSLLHGSLLTVAIASFEFLLAGLYGEHLIKYPNQLEGEEKEFSLSDLTEIGSIDDARRLLAERRVDAFMRRGVTDWSKWSENTLGRSFQDLCLDYDRFNEALQRRHIVVHNGGLVSRLYLERVPSTFPEHPKLGSDLPITTEYMGHALDELEVLGFGLSALAWSRWEPDGSEDASSFLNSRIYDLLKAQRFAPAMKLACLGEHLRSSDSRRWMIAVNGWIAQKRLEGLESCKSTISSWDTTALSERYKLAKACLLEESDEAFRLLALVVGDAETDLSPGEVWDWPLLDNLRSDPRFDTVFSEVGYLNPDQENQPDE
jgi:hypothetical protein